MVLRRAGKAQKGLRGAGRVQVRQFSTQSCGQIVQLMQGCFIFSVDNSFIVKHPAALINTALLQSQDRSLSGLKHV